MLGSGKYEPYLHQIQCAERALLVSSNHFYLVSKNNTLMKKHYLLKSQFVRGDIYVSIVNKTLQKGIHLKIITNKERFGSPRRATTFRTFEGYDCLRSRSSEGIRNIGLDQNLSLWSSQLFLAKFCLEKRSFSQTIQTVHCIFFNLFYLMTILFCYLSVK